MFFPYLKSTYDTCIFTERYSLEIYNMYIDSKKLKRNSRYAKVFEHYFKLIIPFCC